MVETAALAPRPPRAARLHVRWIDTAKGAAILLVVLGHAVAFAERAGIPIGAWAEANFLLTTARMPLFFFVSGMLAASSVNRPLRQFLNDKILLFGYLFVLWVGIDAVTMGFLEPGPVASEATAALLRAATLNTGLWYLAVLPVFYAAARAMRSVPLGVQLGVALLSYVAFASYLIEVESTGINGAGKYLLFFLVGWQGRSTVLALAERVTPWNTLAVCVCLLLLAAATYLLDRAVPVASNVGFVLLPPVAVAAALALSVLLSSSALSRPVEWVGRRTLPLYVLHLPVLSVLVAFVPQASGVAPLVAVTAPVALSLAAIAASYLIWSLTRQVPGLYQKPEALDLSTGRCKPGR